MDYLEYKGYKGSVEYSKEDNCLFGKVQGLPKALILYEGQTSKTCPCDSMKKLLLLLALILLPLAVSAVNLIDGIYYNLNSDTKTAEVVKYLSKKYSGDFVIPSSVTVEGIKYKVTSVGASAFTGCSDLTSITIPNSVTTIFL